MTNRDPKYRCLVCVERNLVLPTRGLRAAGATPVPTIFRRPGKHSHHRHPERRVSFEPVSA